MECRVIMVLLLAIASMHAKGSKVSTYTCNDDQGCEMLGRCTAGQCLCARGFTGPSCGSLDFAPASSSSSILWPHSAALNTVASAWGFTGQHDPSDGLFHAFVTVACGASGVIGQGGGNSWIAHLASPTGSEGPFSLVAMVTPQTTFGPHVAVGPDGTFVHVFRVNVLNDTTLCGGNSSEPLPPSFYDTAYIPASSLVSGDPEVGTSIYIAWSARMAGPWSLVRANITGAGDIHKSNPAIAPLRSPIPYSPIPALAQAGKVNATWAMAYRYNPKGGGEQNAIALASDFRGPWTCVANISAGKGNSEDPFLWQQPDPAQAVTAHILFHNGPHGFHSWGPLDGSSPWRLSPTSSFAFTLNVTMDDGSLVQLERRERPELRFRVDGTPAALYNGVVGPDGSAYVLAQPVN